MHKLTDALQKRGLSSVAITSESILATCPADASHDLRGLLAVAENKDIETIRELVQSRKEVVLARRCLNNGKPISEEDLADLLLEYRGEEGICVIEWVDADTGKVGYAMTANLPEGTAGVPGAVVIETFVKKFQTDIDEMVSFLERAAETIH